jgi:uncharacterized protein with ParB-like and HNH nuclease domain
MATWEPKTIKEIVQDIEEDRIVLPVIQRNLVWDEDKIELLFDSLLKENSFGGIMALGDEKGNQPLFAFRRFSREGELHDSKQQERLDRSILLIIDGQQRLQAFYMGLKGSYNGKELYFNLLSKQDYDFQFAKQESELKQTAPNLEEGATLWYSARTLYLRLNTVDRFQVTNETIEHLQVVDEDYKNTIRENIILFEKLIFEQKTIGISLVKVNRSKVEDERRRMVELFRRLNDGGTRLSALDLAASTLKGFDFRLEKFLRTDTAQFGEIGFHQDEVIKLLFLLRNNYLKEVTDIDKEDAEFAIANSERILKTLGILQKLLKSAKLIDYYRDGGKSIIPLYALAYHIFHKDGNLDKLYDNYDINNPDFANIKAWLYLSVLNGVFSRGCGWIPYRTGIRRILEIVKNYKNALFPASELFRLYETYPLIFSRDISAENLPRWDRNIVFYLIYGCESLSGRDIDHIQPRSLLEKRGVAPEKIHSVANFQLLTATINRTEKRAKELKEWIDWDKNVRKSSYLQDHLIPVDSQYWVLDNFDELLKIRTEAIITRINTIIPTQITESVPNSTTTRQEVDNAGGLNKEYDKSGLWEKLPSEYQNHPVLRDETTLYSIFEKTGCGKRWSGTYRKELASAQLITLADFALLVVTLGIKVTNKNQFGNFYTFIGGTPSLKTQSFGSWAWGVVLGELKKRGLDWTKFVAE